MNDTLFVWPVVNVTDSWWVGGVAPTTGDAEIGVVIVATYGTAGISVSLDVANPSDSHMVLGQSQNST